MLVLGRRRGESIQIDGPCTITVLRVDGDNVRIGIQAEPEVHAMRTEILQRDQDREASQNKGRAAS